MSQLLWQETFQTLDNWNIRERRPWGGEVQQYTNREDNVKVEGGNLKIIGHKEEFAEAHYTSGRINTRDKYEFMYGLIEAKIKLPIGKGFWPAFWLMPHDYKEPVPWPDCGEIDILEAVGKDPEKVCQCLISKNQLGGRSTYNLKNNDTIADWHVYGLLWKEDELIWYVDGVRVRRTDKTLYDSREWEWPFQKPYYILLNMAIGGGWGGQPDNTTPFPATMEVDWVRHYALEGAIPEQPVVPEPEPVPPVMPETPTKNEKLAAKYRELADIIEEPND